MPRCQRGLSSVNTWEAPFIARQEANPLCTAVSEIRRKATTQIRKVPLMHDIRVVIIVACSPFPIEFRGVLRASVGSRLADRSSRSMNRK